jgi:hypothetical protein
MNQKLSDWASVAEIASGVAVVITLAILIIGIRENTDAIRASTYAQSLNALNQWRGSIYESREVGGFWEAFRAGDVDELDSVDTGRLGQFVINLFTIYEHSYFAWQRGLIGGSEWRRFEPNICLQYTRVARLPRVSLAYEGALTKEFQDFVSELCLR